MEEQQKSAGKIERRQDCLAVLREISEAVFLCNRRGKILLANPAFAALVGKSEAEIRGTPAGLLNPPELASLILEQNEAVFADGETRVFESVVPTPGGLRFFRVTKGICESRSVARGGGVYGIAREITEARGVEREIIDTSDRDKERLGHELRENFCQHLVGISLLGNVLYEELAKAGLEQARFARQITTLVKEVVGEVRTLEKGLSVAHLQQGEGLVEALRDLAELVGLQNKIACVVQAPVAKPAVPSETAMYLFRIAQEAVHGALRRSEVRRLLIRITVKPGELALYVRDDGAADIPEEMTMAEWARGEFPIMHYRSRVIGAKLEFHDLKCGGVEMICRVPRYCRRRTGMVVKKRHKLK